jgi:excisionase family DNA binding protein
MEEMVDDLKDRPTCTVAEAAGYLGIGVGLAYAMCREGKIPTVRLGKRVLVRVPALLRLLEGAEAL